MPRTECEDVRSLRLELLVRDLDDLDPTLGEEVEQPHGSDPRIHEREIAVERGDEAHEVHHFAAAVPVREVEGDHVHPGEGVPESAHGRRVRPVADADEQRLLVEPDRVAALHHRGSVSSAAIGTPAAASAAAIASGSAAASHLPRP